jgi:hypothetical protein
MKTTNFLVAASVVALGFISTSVFAQNSTPSTFDKTHPRRAQVNSRLNNQNARTDNKVDNGKMSKAEAAKIHKQDHSIRKEEKKDAAANGGHITKAEQKHINHQENHVSKEIKKH